MSPAGANVILDFSRTQGDKIDLTALDGDIATAAKEGLRADQISFVKTSFGCQVSIDLDGSSSVDMAIDVHTSCPRKARPP